MEPRITQILFALLSSAIGGSGLTEEERSGYSPEFLQELLAISAKHDVAHLLVWGLKQNGLIPEEQADIKRYILNAVYRCERMQYEYEHLCAALEKAQIPFIPLKGAVIRRYYPEPWMRTSCDIDVLVRREDLEKAISYLLYHRNYVVKERATHDVSLCTRTGIYVEIHFDLVEEGRANDAVDVLRFVWNNVSLHENSEYWYEMNDSFFYFYHVAHMAKHFENGGCGIRPFIDLWILDHMKDRDASAREALLSRGRLLKFSKVSRTLSEVWFGGKVPDELSLQMQDFLLYGGAYGSTDNRVALQQKKKGGRLGYVLSRMFIPYTKLKRYYPVLEKHSWLMTAMQIRRWFMLLKPNVAQMAKREIAANRSLSKTTSDEMNVFLDRTGLN